MSSASHRLRTALVLASCASLIGLAECGKSADGGGGRAEGGDGAAHDAGSAGTSEGGAAGTSVEVSAAGQSEGGTAESGAGGAPPEAGSAGVAVGGTAGEAAHCDPNAMPRPDPNAGKTVEAPGEGGCPAGMVAASTFCIDKYEASLVRVADGSTWCPFDNPGTTAVRAISVAGAVPQAYIDGIQAASACSNAGKRLCTNAEWLRACQGPTVTTYPYGNTLQPGMCNDHRAVHPAVEYFGTTDSSIYSQLGNSCLDQLPSTVDRSGALKSCVTAEGAFDMMGNLQEWTADPAGTFRGGNYVDSALNGPGCEYATTAHDTSYWDFGTGFRCCAD